MNNSFFHKFLMPAVLVSTTVFTALNLTFSPQKENPLLDKILLMGNREVKPTLTGVDGNLMIRYVGFTIILSVGSGLTTAEAIRRLQKRHEAKQRQQAEPVLEVIREQHEASLPQAEPFYGNGNDAHAAFQSIDSLDLEIESDWSSHLQEVCADYPECSQGCAQCLTRSHRVEMLQDYQICRIKVPQRQQRLLAIFSEGQYYRFVKSERTRSKASEVAAKRVQRGEQAVITSTKTGYAVWVWEPEAYPDLVA